MKAFGLLAIPLLARPRGAEGLQVPQDQRSTLDVETKIPPLRIFASTFNAGNTKIEENGDFKAQAAELMRGYEKYDVVIAGFQEVQLPPQFGGVLFGKGHNHVFHEKFDSGFGCRRALHYDTVLYVTTMGSRWKIKPMRHATPDKAPSLSDVTNFFTGSGSEPESPPCQLTGTSGCSIDNNKISFQEGVYECGKAVNLLKFELTTDGGSTTVKLCALNTHMSFKAKAAHRAKFIGAAMAEATEKANCDVVVFVGDFNTRLDCDPEGPSGGTPPSQKKTYHLLKQFCNVEPNTDDVKSEEVKECAMKKEKEEFDELRVILKGSTSTTCKVGNAGVETYGFREPELPRFAPSYKLERCPVGKDEFRQMVDMNVDKNTDPNKLNNTKMCFKSDGKLKHRPAWTDRVLFKVPDGADVTTDTYERRVIGEPFKTDHAAVIAGLTIQIPDR